MGEAPGILLPWSGQGQGGGRIGRWDIELAEDGAVIPAV